MQVEVQLTHFRNQILILTAATIIHRISSVPINHKKKGFFGTFFFADLPPPAGVEVKSHKFINTTLSTRVDQQWLGIPSQFDQNDIVVRTYLYFILSLYSSKFTLSDPMAVHRRIETLLFQ